ncbi:zinc-ribbon domain containing protein [Plantactinospora sp. S1510]|uniref:Zinc-ribbon domain containing protein n=1 Tax=Plantactinospora alkalitolerans TaxID=2789879 RepID=A0ABS0GYP3_9ACTN|nr:zinc-ribbon domain containing protein [Plantactinospora alkalitolerans]MBF9131346.1 zinc-ribbon domain containing protein [Plantactinospora alkalitolerans]
MARNREAGQRSDRDHQGGFQPDPGTSSVPDHAGVTWEAHPRYGDIPYRDTAGGYDLDYRPALPAGAVRGDPHRQRDFCNHCQPPRYFYLDEERTCVECGRGFVFGATEQRFWYERLGFQIESVPIRCPACRRADRSRRRLQRRLAEATDAARRQPDDALAQLVLTAATVEHVCGLGTGSLDSAIRAARKAVRLDPNLHLAHYWEARAQELADRRDKAIEAYGQFIDAARHSKRRSTRQLLDDALRRRADLQARSTRSPDGGASNPGAVAG